MAQHVKIGPALTSVVVMSCGLDHLTEQSVALQAQIARANLVVDVSGLVNPHYEDELRGLTGRDEAVAEFLNRDSEVRAVVYHVKNLVSSLLPGYITRGNAHGEVTLVFRCTGGKHRSQFFAELVAAYLRDELLSQLGSDATVSVRHVRDERQ